jgi:hypothetical protein
MQISEVSVKVCFVGPPPQPVHINAVVCALAVFCVCFVPLLMGTEHAAAQPCASLPSFEGSKFDVIQFKVHTGTDDLRDNSSATAQLISVNGQPLQMIDLKDENAPTWEHDSTNTVKKPLSPALAPDEIGAVTITLTSHNAILQTDDNWDINDVEITLTLPPPANSCILATVTGNPWDRLTGSHGTSKTIFTPLPPVVTGSIFPQYQIYALIYAVPGCTSSSSYKCPSTGQLSYGQGSSVGTQVTVTKSFKEGLSLTATGTVGISTTSNNFGISETQGNSDSLSITKGQLQTITVAGNEDGINHDQDYFIILANPQIDLQMTNPTTVGWKMGHSGAFPNFIELTVQDLKNPSKMDPTKLKNLTALGFTSVDYATILKEDPFAGSGALNVSRYTPLGMSYSYSPPDQSSDCNNGVCTCPAVQDTITNTFQTQSIQTTSDEIDVGLTEKLGVAVESVTAAASWAWTNGTSNQNTISGNQSASATIVCPSPGYTGPEELDRHYVVVARHRPIGAVPALGTVVDRRLPPEARKKWLPPVLLVDRWVADIDRAKWLRQALARRMRYSRHGLLPDLRASLGSPHDTARPRRLLPPPRLLLLLPVRSLGH